MSGNREQQEDVFKKKNVDSNTGWIGIQNKTFRRWCNESLKRRGMGMEDPVKDLKDGLMVRPLCRFFSLLLLSGDSHGFFWGS